MPDGSTADPYAPISPPVWEKFPRATPAVAAGVLTAIMTVVMFPPFHAAELAYAFAAPAILWAYRRPSFKVYAWTLFAAQAVAWIGILAWLRHVTWAGLFVLGPLVGVWVGVWYVAVWWTMPRMIGRSTPVRLMAQVGLCGLWVSVEWTRTWLITGFPWLPLAASQWERTSVLQIAAYTGSYGVSFVLVAMNIGFAAYAHRLFFEGQRGFAKRSQEFMFAIFCLLGCLCVQMSQAVNGAYYAKRLARVSFVQPDIPQSEKWEPGEAESIWRTLYGLTVAAGRTDPDVILWPESALPARNAEGPEERRAMGLLAQQVRAPLLYGANIIQGPPEEAIDATVSVAMGSEKWFDAACVATPAGGVGTKYYAKRHLVPFGEYTPWHFLFGWLAKVVPIPDDGTPGPLLPQPLEVDLKHGGKLAAGPLICYEDVFPDLARHSVQQGADALVVLTNDAWYGEEGAAYQHAAHSVLRAVETRRPVLRCGNAGWSGWITEYGSVGIDDPDRGLTPNIMLRDGSVYFRGLKTIQVLRDSRWIGRQTFYVRHGDWFVLLSAALAVFGYWLMLSAATAPARRSSLLPSA